MKQSLYNLWYVVRVQHIMRRLFSSSKILKIFPWKSKRKLLPITWNKGFMGTFRKSHSEASWKVKKSVPFCKVTKGTDEPLKGSGTPGTLELRGKERSNNVPKVLFHAVFAPSSDWQEVPLLRACLRNLDTARVPCLAKVFFGKKTHNYSGIGNFPSKILKKAL